MFFWKKEKKTQYPEFSSESPKGADDEALQLLMVIDYLTDGILVFNEYNTISFINAQAAKFMEVKKEDVSGSTVFKLNAFRNFQHITQFLGGGLREVFREIVHIKEDLILEITTIPMMSGASRIGRIVVLHDVTREKLVDMMKSEFVTVAAHRLRTPTSGIKWSLRMLLDGDLGEMSPKQKEVLEKTYNTNEKVINLINDLLNVARIEEGRFLGKPLISNIEEVISSVLEDHKEEAQKRKIKLEFKKPEIPVPQVMLDVNKMKIALGNLMDNSIRYSRPNSKVVISVSQENDDEIQVAVKDNGVGIPRNQQNKVFTKFFRGDNIMTMETEGTGLGLFITKQIIEAHGGRIWFDSQKDKGATFYLTLPVKEKFSEYLSEEFY